MSNSRAHSRTYSQQESESSSLFLSICLSLRLSFQFSFISRGEKKAEIATAWMAGFKSWVNNTFSNTSDEFKRIPTILPAATLVDYSDENIPRTHNRLGGKCDKDHTIISDNYLSIVITFRSIVPGSLFPRDSVWVLAYARIIMF